MEYTVGDVYMAQTQPHQPAEVGGLNLLIKHRLFNSNGPRGSEQYKCCMEFKRTTVFYYVYCDPAYAGVDPLACSWRVTNDWPVPSTPQRWYLNKGTTQHTGILSLNPPSTAESQSYVYNPSNPCPTNGGNNLYDTHVDNSDVKIGQGSTDQRGNGFYYNNGLPNIVSRSDVITFTSEALICKS